MRLIDADALADVLFDTRKNYPQWVADAIGNMPDAVVRCRECKHYHKGHCICDDTIYWYREPEWFCADGERKESR